MNESQCDFCDKVIDHKEIIFIPEIPVTMGYLEKGSQVYICPKCLLSILIPKKVYQAVDEYPNGGDCNCPEVVLSFITKELADDYIKGKEDWKVVEVDLINSRDDIPEVKRMKVREMALAKLTDEEKEALGLTM